MAESTSGSAAASASASSRRPPPLPPRLSPHDMDTPPPYEAFLQQQKAFAKAAAPAGLMHHDPRSSSQQSLLPVYEERDERRKLLLIYIHGFMGAETSFRSFPAHVHNLLAILLSDTHVVHSKIYPRYKSKGRMTIARDDFSKWLEPHVDGLTDTVLLGHSMGGLLSAEVALIPLTQPATRPLKHRILGTINFDVPFLGMHPGVVKSGLASIFKPAEESGDKWYEPAASEQGVQPDPSISRSPAPNRTDTLWAPGTADPNYNPSFQNDVVLPVRKGWQSAWHFISKHSDDLTTATKKLVSSHMEFGGAMANYSELKTRYARLRALEEADERVRQSVVQGEIPPRVRFVNYYTASTGRAKKPKSPQRGRSPSSNRSRQTSQTRSTSRVHGQESMSKASLHSAAGVEQRSESERYQVKNNAQPPPARPPPLDLSYIQDAAVRELVQKEHTRAVQAYEAALQEHEKAGGSQNETQQKAVELAIQTPTPTATKPEYKMSHSEREALRQEREKQRMEHEARRMRGEPEPEQTQTEVKDVYPQKAHSPPPVSVMPAAETASIYDSKSLAPVNSRESEAPQKPKKDRLFCTVPPKDSNGERDPAWVRVFMENVDEVGAHCGLFFVDERYERLVGDVASRIEAWVNDDNRYRVSRSFQTKA